MLYVLYSESFENSAEKRQIARPAHLARLEALKAQGRLIIAGPCPAIDSEDPGPAGFTGSVIIAEFDNLESAQSWADSDPYATDGVYKNTTVKPYIKVLP